MLSYVHCVCEDPVRREMLYVGTENGVHFTYDDGSHWMPLQNNLPHAPVHWLLVQEHFSDLVIGTYGRGFWILDDITPLREINEDILESDIHLFRPRPAYRFQEIHSTMSTRTDADGKNPPYGASIHYYFKDTPKDSISLTILNEAGKKIRQIKKFPRKKGINRVWWNLRHDRATEPKLRTAPLGHPGEGHGPERLRYGIKGWRTLVTWGQGGYIGPRVIPGTYTVRLSVGDKIHTENLEVRKDPNTESSMEDIREQVGLALKIRDDISSIAKMVNKLEWIRRQIDNLIPMLKEDSTLKVFIKSANELDKKCIEVEKNFFQLTLTGTGADDLRGPTMLYSKFMSLARGVQTGDFAPTTQQIGVYELHHKALEKHKEQFNRLVKEDVTQFNKLLMESNLFNIIIPNH